MLIFFQNQPENGSFGKNSTFTSKKIGCSIGINCSYSMIYEYVHYMR